MLDFIDQYGLNVYSQNGEDGIIEECLKRIKPIVKQSVEFGAADGFYCSNTAKLRDDGWDAYMYDLMAYPPFVKEKRITPSNVNDLPECSVLSIDVDGNDYNIWDAYTGQPDIVVIEINSSIEPTQPVPVSDPQHGTAYLPMVLLGERKGYFLLCHTGNLIFILEKHRALFPEIDPAPIGNHHLFFNRQWL